jgi:hypothetical protein
VRFCANLLWADLVPIRITHFWYTPVHDTDTSKETSTAPGGGE